MSATKATLGFAWDRWNRGPEREVRQMDEYTPEVRLDTRAGQRARIRTAYSFRVRDGERYDELAPFRVMEPGVMRPPLTPPIRKYDEADNQRHNVHLLSQLFAGEDADVTLSGNLHVTDWDDHFGLVSDDGFDVGIDTSYRPHERVEIVRLLQLRLERAAPAQRGVGWDARVEQRPRGRGSHGRHRRRVRRPAGAADARRPDSSFTAGTARRTRPGRRSTPSTFPTSKTCSGRRPRASGIATTSA